MVQTLANDAKTSSAAGVLLERKCQEIAELIAQITKIEISPTAVAAFLTTASVATQEGTTDIASSDPTDQPGHSTSVVTAVTGLGIDVTASSASDTTPDSDLLPTSPTNLNIRQAVIDLVLIQNVGIPVLTDPDLPSVLIPPPPAPASQDWHRLYRGFYYHVPEPAAWGPFYSMTKGRRSVGIIAGWEHAGALTLKVSGAIQRRVDSVVEGVALFEIALKQGRVEVLP